MNILQDLRNILIKNDDHEHAFRVTVDPHQISVELIWSEDDDENVILPIVYEYCVEFAYIPDKEYRSKYNVSDFGIDKLEVKLALDIINYLELHGTEIIETCCVIERQPDE